MKPTFAPKTGGKFGLVVASTVIIASLPFLNISACAADAAANWNTHCASCHGKDGKGQTKAGRMASVKDMTEASYQEGVKDDRAFTQIKEGLKDEKGKERMKPFKEKLTDDEIKALIAHVRSFKK